MDARAILEEGTYPTYTDGVGWTNDGLRADGYCPVCCPNNFVRWQKKKEEEASRVAERARRIAADLENAARALEEDKARAAVGGSAQPFTYQNGDTYQGEWHEGVPHGLGCMTYAEDGTIFDGQWKNGKQEGHGTKSYLDGIEYTGDFKDDMMHGQGRFTMSDGTVLEGAFLEDEWQGGS